MNTWMYFLMMIMMTTTLSDLVKTRKEQSASTNSLLGDDGLHLSCIRAYLENRSALYYHGKEFGGACRWRSTVRHLDNELPKVTKE